MWESLTIALSCLGFAAAVILMLVELPAVLEQIRSWSAQHRHTSW
jgi:hypothetical protein